MRRLMSNGLQRDPEENSDSQDESQQGNLDTWETESAAMPTEDTSLVDQLGVTDTSELLFGKDGRIFSAAGRLSPVAEFGQDVVLLHPPQKPLDEEAPCEDIYIQADERGILLNELGQQRHIPGAKFNGNRIFWLMASHPETHKHYAACMQDDTLRTLYYDGEPATTDIIFRLRNKTHDGELNIYTDLAMAPEEP